MAARGRPARAECVPGPCPDGAPVEAGSVAGKVAAETGGEVAATETTIVWVQGGGCDGCTMSVLGATSPRIEELLAGTLTRSPLEIVHPHLALDAGDAYVAGLEAVRQGEASPFVLVVEGSMFDQSLAGDGSFSQLGVVDGQPMTVERWVEDLSARADVVVAIGTCATWGGVPAGHGNVTGAGGVGDLLGADFQSRAGLPVVNVPGCAPSGDAFLETLQYVLLHLDGVVPLDLDEEARPRWLYGEQTPLRRVRAGDVPREPSEPLAAACPVPSRGWINRLGGCAAVGGACNGCTRRDFPDRTLPLLVAS
jgi:hydrogenase small subunit